MLEKKSYHICKTKVNILTTKNVEYKPPLETIKKQNKIGEKTKSNKLSVIKNKISSIKKYSPKTNY